jgi:hypothetical protein
MEAAVTAPARVQQSAPAGLSEGGDHLAGEQLDPGECRLHVPVVEGHDALLLPPESGRG